MPIYEYECTSCGHKLEVVQKMADAPLSTCDLCQKPSLEKLVSRSSFQLKGGGWYSDLYGSSSKSGGSTASSSASSSASAASPPAPAASTPSAPAKSESKVAA